MAKQVVAPTDPVPVQPDEATDVPAVEPVVAPVRYMRSLWSKVEREGGGVGVFRQWNGSRKYYGVDDERHLTIAANPGDVLVVSVACAAILDAIQAESPDTVAWTLDPP